MFTHPGPYLPEESKLSLPVCITGLAQDYISMAGSTPSFCLPSPGQPAKPNVTGLLDRGSTVVEQNIWYKLVSRDTSQSETCPYLDVVIASSENQRETIVLL